MQERCWSPLLRYSATCGLCKSLDGSGSSEGGFHEQTRWGVAVAEKKKTLPLPTALQNNNYDQVSGAGALLSLLLSTLSQAVTTAVDAVTTAVDAVTAAVMDKTSPALSQLLSFTPFT